MEHVAIMKKSWGLTEKILSGEKKIESRWYLSKRVPWDRAKTGEIIYFKDSGKPVRIKAEIDRVMQFSDLTPKKVKEILSRYGKDDGFRAGKIPEFFRRFKNKKYCMLIFLKNPKKIREFEIDKRGFGNMAAWIAADRIKSLEKK